MRIKSNHFLFLWVCLFWSVAGQAQQDSLELDFKEYLGYVKKYHPIVKQAQLTLAVGEANLMKARGGFDPKIEVDYDRKQFKDTDYWERLNGTFKIPAWFGFEFKGNYQQNDGYYLNPDETLPTDGLYSLGVSVSLAKGFWVNERMATLRKAKFFREQSEADQDLMVNEILYQASLAYFDWLKSYRDARVIQDFLTNAQTRFQGIKKSALAGDLAAVDTLEAKIVVRNRELGYEQAKVELLKKSLQLSNFLWIEDVPVELQPEVVPNLDTAVEIDMELGLLLRPLDSLDLEAHPKMRSLDYKIEGLAEDRRLKANKLLPQLDVEYNFLTESPDRINSLAVENFKGGVTFSMPLFLRKERGDLKLAKFKLMDAEYDRDNAQVAILNKIRGIYGELESYEVQNQLIADIVADYSALLSAEERKFSFGESSLFLINSRESKLIDAYLKRNEMQNKFLKTKANLFKSLALNPIGVE